jgi:hypothetical protein
MQDADGSGRGPEKLRNLKDNSNYFRAALLRMGLTVLGDWDSPVMVRPPAVMRCHPPAMCLDPVSHSNDS